MKDLFTKENIKKLIIAAAIALGAYFGYDVVISPKDSVKTEVAPVDVNDSMSTDSL